MTDRKPSPVPGSSVGDGAAQRDDGLDGTGASDAPEQRDADALRLALEGHASADVPDSVLQTAAFVRFSAGAGQLSSERRAALRADLLASLREPAAAPARASEASARRRQRQRRGLWRWFTLGLPVFAAAAVTLGVLVVGDRGEHLTQHPAAASAGRGEALSAQKPGSAITADEAVRGAAERAEAERDPYATGDRIAAAPSVTPAMPNGEIGSVAGGRSSNGARVAPTSSAKRSAESPREPLREQSSRASSEVSRGVAPPSAEGGRDEVFRADERADGAKGRVAAGAARGRGASFEHEARQRRAELQARLGNPRLDAAHAQLDQARTTNDLQRAKAELTALASAGLEGAGESSVALALRQDLYCRLAEVALRLGDPAAALEWTRRGIELGGPRSVFSARLHALRGQAHEALGDDALASASYMQALDINETLLDESLDGTGETQP